MTNSWFRVFLASPTYRRLFSGFGQGADYVGCYRDAATRAMTGGLTQGNDMTVRKCKDRCKDEVMFAN